MTSLNGRPHNLTIRVKGGKVTSAACACGATFGRGKTAAAGASNHILAWNATYATEYA